MLYASFQYNFSSLRVLVAMRSLFAQGGRKTLSSKRTRTLTKWINLCLFHTSTFLPQAMFFTVRIQLQHRTDFTLSSETIRLLQRFMVIHSLCKNMKGFVCSGVVTAVSDVFRGSVILYIVLKNTTNQMVKKILIDDI